MPKIQYYIITAEESITEEPIENTLINARKTQKYLQKIEDDQAGIDDVPPREVQIFKVELTK